MAGRKQEFYASIKAVLDKKQITEDAEELQELLSGVKIDFDSPEFEKKVRSIVQKMSKETMSIIGESFNNALKLLGKKQIDISKLIVQPNENMWKEMGRIAGKYYAQGLQGAIQATLRSDAEFKLTALKQQQKEARKNRDSAISRKSEYQALQKIMSGKKDASPLKAEDDIDTQARTVVKRFVLAQKAVAKLGKDASKNIPALMDFFTAINDMYSMAATLKTDGNKMDNKELLDVFGFESLNNRMHQAIGDTGVSLRQFIAMYTDSLDQASSKAQLTLRQIDIQIDEIQRNNPELVKQQEINESIKSLGEIEDAYIRIKNAKSDAINKKQKNNILTALNYSGGNGNLGSILTNYQDTVANGERWEQQYQWLITFVKEYEAKIANGSLSKNLAKQYEPMYQQFKPIAANAEKSLRRIIDFSDGKNITPEIDVDMMDARNRINEAKQKDAAMRAEIEAKITAEREYQVELAKKELRLAQEKAEIERKIAENKVGQSAVDDGNADDIAKENGTLEEKLELLKDIASEYGQQITQKDRNRYEELNQKDGDVGLTSREEDKYYELGEQIEEAEAALEEFGATYDKIILKLENGKKVEILSNDKGLRDLNTFDSESYGSDWKGIEIKDVIFERVKQNADQTKVSVDNLNNSLEQQKQIEDANTSVDEVAENKAETTSIKDQNQALQENIDLKNKSNAIVDNVNPNPTSTDTQLNGAKVAIDSEALKGVLAGITYNVKVIQDGDGDNTKTSIDFDGLKSALHDGRAYDVRVVDDGSNNNTNVPWALNSTLNETNNKLDEIKNAIGKIKIDDKVKEDNNINQDKIKDDIEKEGRLIANQKDWISYLDKVLDDNNFTTSGKKEATEQLRAVTRSLIDYRMHPDNYAGQQYAEEMMNVRWNKAYKEAEKQGVAQSTLTKNDADASSGYERSLQTLQKAKEYRTKVLEESMVKLRQLQQQLVNGNKPENVNIDNSLETVLKAFGENIISALKTQQTSEQPDSNAPWALESTLQNINKILQSGIKVSDGSSDSSKDISERANILRQEIQALKAKPNSDLFDFGDKNAEISTKERELSKLEAKLSTNNDSKTPWALDATLKGETNTKLNDIKKAIGDIKFDETSENSASTTSDKTKGSKSENISESNKKQSIIDKEVSKLYKERGVWEAKLADARAKNNAALIQDAKTKINYYNTEIAQQRTKSKLTDDELRKIEELAKAEQERAIATKNANAESKQQCKDEKKALQQRIKTSQQEARWSKANSLSRSGRDTIMSAAWKIDDESIDLSRVEVVQNLDNALIKLQETQRRITENGGVVNREDRAILSNQMQDVAQYNAQLKEVVKNYEQLSGDNAVVLKNKVFNEYGDVEEQLLSAAKAASNGKMSVKSFDAASKSLTYTVKTGKNEFTEYTMAVRSVDGAFVNLKGTTRKAETFLEATKRKMKEISSYFTGMAMVSRVTREFRKGLQYIREIDSALTELKKVTNETEEAYDKFLNTAAKTSSVIGSTLSDFTRATAEFAKLGYNIEQSSKMAEAAIIYKNVGDGIADIGTASDSIISTLKAFGFEAEKSMLIVDKFNEVGNNFAITSKGIGDALQKSASALFEAGNDIDESIGLITAAM